MGGGMEPDPVPNGAKLTLLTIRVARREQSTFRLPERLSTFDGSWERNVTGPARQIALGFQGGQWLLGGRAFDMMETTPDEIVPAGATQVWELGNFGGMMMMMGMMAHPIHLHGRQFRVLSRQPSAGAFAPPGSVREGLVDQGWMTRCWCCRGRSCGCRCISPTIRASTCITAIFWSTKTWV